MRKGRNNIEAMEARSVKAIPIGQEWQYEPKWDGFRCLLTRDADAVAMYSKSGQDLSRYFPEVIAAALTLREKSFVLDGEIVVPIGSRFSFNDLLQRVHREPRQEVGSANSCFVSCVRPSEEGQERAWGEAFGKATRATRRLRWSLLLRCKSLSSFASQPEAAGRSALACVGRRRKRRSDGEPPRARAVKASHRLSERSAD